MLGLRVGSVLGRLFRRAAAADPFRAQGFVSLKPSVFQACSSFATGPRQEVGTVYELRTYDIKPAKTKEFLELVNKSIKIRMVHSPMIGFWTAEFGAMNKAFHIWKYDNFAHRAAVRKAVINDKEWQEKLAAILPLLDKQHMEIAYMVPWCELGNPPKEGQLCCSSTCCADFVGSERNSTKTQKLFEEMVYGR